MSSKTSSVPSWHQFTAERRPLRKHKLGPPDIYPQEPRQEEDNLTAHRLQKGYHLQAHQYEHDSLVYLAKSAKLEKLDFCLSKSAGVIAGAFNKKADVNHVLDKERRKSKDAAAAANTVVQNLQAKLKERAAWFTDLARGKPLAQLAKRVPTFSPKNEEMLEFIMDYRIPSYRAIWFLKLNAVLSFNQHSKTKKASPDSFVADYRILFYSALTNLMTKMWTIDDLPNSPLYKENWSYLTVLTRRAFDEGVIDRQDFLNDLCTAFSDFYLPGRSGDIEQLRNTEGKPAHLRTFLIFFSHFMMYINVNIILARRTAHMLAMKLRLMKMEYEEKSTLLEKSSSTTPTTPNGDAQPLPTNSETNTPSTPEYPDPPNVFHSMVRCKAYRSNIYLMTALLQNVVVEVPAAVVWNKFKVSMNRVPFIISQLCGSPLDVLPCPIDELPVPPGKESEKFVELVKLRAVEITRRSQAVEDRWCFKRKDQLKYSKRIRECLDVIGILDVMDVLQAQAIPIAAKSLFEFSSENWDEEVLLRVKLMLHWAVTAEREGTHRALVVAKILRHHINQRPSFPFGSQTIHDIIEDYFMKDRTKVGSKFYAQEFASTMQLFMELIRYDLFNHDWFVQYMIKNNQVNYNDPIMKHLVKREEPKKQLPSMQSMFEDLSPDEPSHTSLVLPTTEQKDEHIWINEEMWHKHLILIQVPLPQTEEYRSAANQRAMIVYGMTESRDAHLDDLKKIAREICKIWQKRVYIQFYADTERMWCPKRYTAQKVQETLSKFRQQTFYDQGVICGWCAESFVDMIRDFISGSSLQMPGADGLDILCSMFETLGDINAVLDLCGAVTSMLPNVEKVVRSLAAECIPGSLSGQLGFVFVSFFSKHWHYFIHANKAADIVTGLYSLIEKVLKAKDYPITSWGRVIAVFVYHARVQLSKSKLAVVKIGADSSDFQHIFNQSGNSCADVFDYNRLFFRDVLDEKILRYYSYHSYKKRLPSFKLPKNCYSFVINALVAAAKGPARDFDRLADLSVFCGHISAQVPTLASYWIAAIRSLCCPGTNFGYLVLLKQIPISDCSLHYSIATFTLLLAGKYAFSVPKLITELLNSVFAGMLKKDSSYGGFSGSSSDNEAGVCLALQILTMLCCKSDEPIALSNHYKGTSNKVKLVPSTADENILSMIHWNEMDNVLFPMLSNICILQDTLRNRHKDLELELPRSIESCKYRREYLMILLKASITVICEQEWVTAKMYDIVQTKNMEAFSHERLKQNCVGQQLLRLGIRRRSERELLRELTVCSGNSKKALIDRLLGALNMWNLRATLFDLKLMIKEIGSEQKHSNQNNQFNAADALMVEIGRCCRELFTSAYHNRRSIPTAENDQSFRFGDISKYWLIAPLVRLCPEPLSSPSTNKSVASKFLIEASKILDVTNDTNHERTHQSTWLLSQSAFVNLILCCMKCSKSARECLIDSLRGYLQGFIVKTKENPSFPWLHKNCFEREGMLLRLTLAGGIFPYLCVTGQSEQWSILIFQIMLYGLVSPDKDRVLFDSCYDMVSTLMLWTLVDQSNQTTSSSDSHEQKYRWPSYTLIIKKIRKEVTEHKVPRDISELRYYLPIVKSIQDHLIVEPYGYYLGQPPPRVKSGPIVIPGIRHGRLALQAAEKSRTSTFDYVHSHVPDQNPRIGWKWTNFQAAKVDRHPVPIQKYLARIVHHRHSEGVRPAPIYLEHNQLPQPDQFLVSPVFDVSADVSSSVSSATTPTGGPGGTTDLPPASSSSTNPTSTGPNNESSGQIPTSSPPVGTPNRDKDDSRMDGSQPPNSSTPTPSTANVTPTTLEPTSSSTPDQKQSTTPLSASPKRGRKRPTSGGRTPNTKQKRSNSRSDTTPQGSLPYPWPSGANASASAQAAGPPQQMPYSSTGPPPQHHQGSSQPSQHATTGIRLQEFIKNRMERTQEQQIGPGGHLGRTSSSSEFIHQPSQQQPPQQQQQQQSSFSGTNQQSMPAPPQNAAPLTRPSTLPSALHGPAVASQQQYSQSNAPSINQQPPSSQGMPMSSQSQQQQLQLQGSNSYMSAQQPRNTMGQFASREDNNRPMGPISGRPPMAGMMNNGQMPMNRPADMHSMHMSSAQPSMSAPSQSMMSHPMNPPQPVMSNAAQSGMGGMGSHPPMSSHSMGGPAMSTGAPPSLSSQNSMPMNQIGPMNQMGHVNHPSTMSSQGGMQSMSSGPPTSGPLPHSMNNMNTGHMGPSYMGNGMESKPLGMMSQSGGMGPGPSMVPNPLNSQGMMPKPMMSTGGGGGGNYGSGNPGQFPPHSYHSATSSMPSQGGYGNPSMQSGNPSMYNSQMSGGPPMTGQMTSQMGGQMGSQMQGNMGGQMPMGSHSGMPTQGNMMQQIPPNQMGSQYNQQQYMDSRMVNQQQYSSQQQYMGSGGGGNY